MKVAYIPEDTITKAQELLQDGEKVSGNWVMQYEGQLTIYTIVANK